MYDVLAIFGRNTMVSGSSKVLALIITAIRNLRELKGSTSREIFNYLSSVYDITPNVARRQMHTALKRGVEYGILKKNGGHYILPMIGDIKCQEIAEQEVNLLDMCRKNKMQRKLGCKCKRKRSRRRKRKKRFCKCKRKRRAMRRKRRCGVGYRRRRRRRKRKCRCGGLGSRGDRNRMKRASTPQADEKFPKERTFKPSLDAYDSGASEKTSLSSFSSVTD